MKRIGRVNRVSKLPAAALALAFLWGASGAGAAAARADCLLPSVQSFLGRSLAGLGCFAELVHCLQRRLA